MSNAELVALINPRCPRELKAARARSRLLNGLINPIPTHPLRCALISIYAVRRAAGSGAKCLYYSCKYGNTCCIHTQWDFSSICRGGALGHDHSRGGDRVLRPSCIRLRGGRHRREGPDADHERFDPRGGSERRAGRLHEVSETSLTSAVALNDAL